MFALGRSPNIVREPAEEQVRKSVQSFLPLSSSSNPLLAPDDAETRRTTPHTPATFRVVARLGRNFICQCHATSGLSTEQPTLYSIIFQDDHCFYGKKTKLSAANSGRPTRERATKCGFPALFSHSFSITKSRKHWTGQRHSFKRSVKLVCQKSSWYTLTIALSIS